MASAGDDIDTKLEAQAQSMAEKALEKLAPSERSAKIAKVKEGILKRLKAQSSASAGPGPSSAAAKAASIPLSRLAAPPPPTGLQQVPSLPSSAAAFRVEKLPGIVMCGDEPWFADPSVRRALRDKVVAAHAEQKILVGPPADEIKRICPGGGRVLGAGAVLRLGGAHLGGYGDADVAYAYRQLSRALHPDKNPGNAEAANAFKRLTEAADELRQGLAEARAALKTLCEATGGTVTTEMSERPQTALFAEACRVVTGVLGLSGEGEVPASALRRGMAAFSSSGFYHDCQAQALLSMWYDAPYLLDCITSPALRTAYDCSPKHLRTQFLCALNRATLAEQKRNGGLRGNWQLAIMQFPEFSLWRELREKITTRVCTPDKASKWDSKDKVVSAQYSGWAIAWRDKIRNALAQGVNEAVPVQGSAIRRMAAEIWREIIDWARGENAQRHLELFTADLHETMLQSQSALAADWAFVPAADLLLIVGEDVVGMTAEGVFLEALQGVPQPSAMEKREDKIDESKAAQMDNGRQKSEKERADRAMEDRQKQIAAMGQGEWEKLWRNKMQVNRWKNDQRGVPSWQRGHSPMRRRSSSSSSRGRRKRSRRHRSRSRRR